jgi:uncharacterized delta-60 repeat protein
MEENVQELLKDKNENVVQFNFENNTSSPIAINLFDTASLTSIPTSGSVTNTYTASNDLLPSLPPSLFALNPNNGTFIATSLTASNLRLINTNTNTTNNNFDNTDGFDSIGVLSIALQTDGKILVGGIFNTYKSITNNYIIRLNSDGTKDLSFDNSVGFNSGVLSIVIQPDGKILCGGDFTSYKGLVENRIIRLNSDGTKDLTFDNSVGFDAVVDSIVLQPDGKILCGGQFTTYKGLTENRIIRLNSDGSKDVTFDNSIGFDNRVFEIALQPDGKILCGGVFTTYKGITNNSIIRLNSDGTKDLTFDNSIGFDAQVNTISIQTDGKILCGGQFTTYKGVTNNRIIRLNSDGSIDLTFDNSVGFNSGVLSIVIQPDGKIIVGGFFTTYKGITNNSIIRLNSDGTKDLTFDNSIGFNAQVLSIVIQPDGKIIVGGFFITYKGYTNNHIVKLNSDGISASTLNILGNFITDIIYNSNNNVFYAVNTTTLFKLSSDGQSIQSYSVVNGTTITYNPNNNYLYISSGTDVNVFDCATNTLLTPIVLGSGNATTLSEVTSSNEIYYFDNTSNLLEKIDCLTNTVVLINLALPNISTSLNTLPYYNGYLYAPSNSSDKIDIVDTNTDTYFNSITISSINPFTCKFTAINPITNQLFVTDNSLTRQYAVIDLQTNTLVSVNTLSGLGGTYGVIYNSLTNSMYISGSLFSVVTFTATPFFIGGSVNYNTFVNSLNGEPIYIEEIRILTQNQTQLYNQVQFTKIDSSGNQIFFPEFPINKIDSMQEQGNIAGLKLYGLVFDGRTYINQYVINANQVVSFEIYYKQLDRLSATPTYPIFFKPKVQLKEYIKNEFSNYDIEI